MRNIYDDKLINQLRKDTKSCYEISDAILYLSSVLKVSRKQAGRINRKYKIYQPEKLQADFHDVYETFNNLVKEKDIKVATVEKTKLLQEVIDECKIDTEKFNVKNFRVEEKSNGKFTWAVSCERNKFVPYGEKGAEEYLNFVKTNSPKWELKGLINDKSLKLDGNLYLIGIPDIHMGKLASDSFTNWGDYDSNIAKELFNKALEDLIIKVSGFNIDRFLFPVGNDLLHVNNDNNTTAAGTLQDTDSRVSKMFNNSVSLMTIAIEKLCKFRPVDVIIVRSNHDYDTIMYVGEVLKAYFKDNKNVTINNSPTQRKYYVYGKNLLGFTHGNEEKHASLPLIMCNEQKENWSNTDFRFWITGHYHFTQLKDYQGVKVCILPSISGSDRWHVSKGYVGAQRGAVGMLFNKNDGLIAEFWFNIKQ